MKWQYLSCQSASLYESASSFLPIRFSMRSGDPQAAAYPQTAVISLQKPCRPSSFAYIASPYIPFSPSHSRFESLFAYSYINIYPACQKSVYKAVYALLGRCPLSAAIFRTKKERGKFLSLFFVRFAFAAHSFRSGISHVRCR